VTYEWARHQRGPVMILTLFPSTRDARDCILSCGCGTTLSCPWGFSKAVPPKHAQSELHHEGGVQRHQGRTNKTGTKAEHKDGKAVPTTHVHS
jgi:hypothetical protein